MTVPLKILTFLGGLVVLFAAALGVGNAVGPTGEEPDRLVVSPAESGAGTAAGSGELPGGLMTSQDGYTLAPAQATLDAGTGRLLSFRIIGPDGAVVNDYAIEHEKELHLIVVRRDFTGFQHVHPARAADGTWSVEVDLTPGSWRVFADFTPRGGQPLTLGVDVAVPGNTPAPAPAPVTRQVEVHGYTVSVTGELVAGEHSMLTLNVAKDGRPVTDLEPYLGANGHLVALRAGDLAYLHVHPSESDDTGTAGPDIEFGTEVPSAGRYHLYLDFKHDGVVHSAPLVLEAGKGAVLESDQPESGQPEGGQGDDHDH